jgi:hypothetical protein
MSYDAFLEAFYTSQTTKHVGAIGKLLRDQSKKNALIRLKKIKYFHVLLFS